MAAFYVNVTEPPYNAPNNGTNATATTAAIQDAIDDVIAAGGGMIVFPQGTYLVTSLDITIPTSLYHGIQLRGAGYSGTTIKRHNNTSAILLDVNGHGVSLSDLRFEDTDPNGSSTLPLVRFIERNDCDVHRCWFSSGHVCVRCEFDTNVADSEGGGDQISFTSCIFEAGRQHGLHFYGFSNARVIGNAFFRHGVYHAQRNAQNNGAIKIEAIPDHSAPVNFAIAGNYFLHSQLAHHIQINRGSGVAITGNFFNLAGIYDEGAHDDINLVNSSRIAISGNVSTGVGDPLFDQQNPPTRVTRYCVNIDADCRKVRVGDNSFEPGMSGTLSDAAPDTFVAASVDGNGPRKTLNASVSWTPGTIAAGAGTSTTVTVTGAAVGDTVSVGWSTLGAGAFVLTGNVSAANTVNVALFNGTPYAFNGGTGTLTITVWKT